MTAWWWGIFTWGLEPPPPKKRKAAALKAAALRLNLDGNTRRFWEPKTATAGRPAAPGDEDDVVSAKRKVRSARVRVTESSGNVFADLGVAHPERELIKAELSLQIYRIIRERGLSQKEVGKLLGISQPQVSVLARNRGASFSVGRLLEFLWALGQDVEISVTPARKGRGEISLAVA